MKIWNRVAFASALAGIGMALAACGTIHNPITQNEVYDLENAYGVAQGAANAYAALPYCHAGVISICKKGSVVVLLDGADKKARIALTALQNFTTNPSNYPGLTFAQLMATAKSAISTMQQIETANPAS